MPPQIQELQARAQLAEVFSGNVRRTCAARTNNPQKLIYAFLCHKAKVRTLRGARTPTYKTIISTMSGEKTDPPPIKMEEQPLAKKARKEDDERVNRAAQMILKSPILSVPQVR